MQAELAGAWRCQAGLNRGRWCASELTAKLPEKVSRNAAGPRAQKELAADVDTHSFGQMSGGSCTGRVGRKEYRRKKKGEFLWQYLLIPSITKG